METIKIDDETLQVADLPTPVQNMVVLYENILQKENDAKIELAIHEAAKLEISNRIMEGVRKHKAEAESKALGNSDDASDAS
jgi:hypothetical protein